MEHQEQISKLTLLLLYLTSWQEKEFGTTIQRSWKGYDFDVLNKLEEDGLISQSKTAKSVYFTEKGMEAARELEQKLSS
jgi:DNA-binding PadR family transcriptional regulator